MPFSHAQSPRAKPRNVRFRRLIGTSLACLSITAAFLWFALPWLFPLPSPLLRSPDASPLILDRYGNPLLHLTLPDFTRSAPASANSIPHDFILCTLAAEDRRFFTHSGIDLLAVLRASRDACSNQKFVSGASTITQQLIKISSPPAPRTLPTKLHESLVARRLEMSWPKSRILLAYLNRLDYGNLRVGPAEAARFYFQKPLGDLSLAECALLAALPQSPSRLNPLRHLRRAIDRRNRILNLLARDQSLPAQRIQAALAEPPNLRPLTEAPPPAPWLQQEQFSQTTASHGQAVHTTIDLSLQQDANRIVSEETSKLRNANLRHAAAVIIHNPTREILCLVSSANWNDPRGGEFNGALVPRSPGSTLKPWLYLLAMERNHLVPSSILEDIPTPFRTPQGVKLPENYDRRYRGPVTLREALACSLNVPAMRTLNDIGGPTPLANLLVSLGFDTLGPTPSEHGLGLAIGNAPVRLLTLTNSYATLASLGFHQEPKFLLPESSSKLPKPTTFHLPIQRIHFLLIANILSDPVARTAAFPPGGPLDLPFRCAVKTGTSSDFRDNWCVGFTPEFTVGVWAGNFENQPMKGISGIAGAAPIFHRLMLRLHPFSKISWFPDDPSLIQASVDRRNGFLLPQDQSFPYALHDWFPAHRIPRPAAASDYDPEGRSILPPSCAAWFSECEHVRHREFALPPSNSPNHPPLQILRPTPGATFLIDPEVPSGTDRLIPQTNPPNSASWTCQSLKIQQSQSGTVILLEPGQHQLQVTDTRSGSSQTIPIQVKSMKK